MKKSILLCLISLLVVSSQAQVINSTVFSSAGFFFKNQKITNTRSKVVKQLFSTTQVSKTINVPVAGTLNSLLTITEKTTVTDLTISGELDARDFKILRDSMLNLSVLDIGAVSIIAYSGLEGTVEYSINYQANQIPEYCFYIPAETIVNENTTLTSIILPHSLTSFGNLAFAFCKSLSSISIPATMLEIGYLPFVACSAKIDVEAANPNYSSIDGILYDKTQKTLMHFPTTNTANFSIPSSVESISEYAFCFNDKISAVEIPVTVKYIGHYAFTSCSAIITVNSANSNYSTLDGVLFNKAKTNLIQCNTSKTGSYVIPTAVDTLGDNSFYNCIGLTALTIPSSVLSISDGSFSFCSGLTSITVNSLPASLGSNVFIHVNQETCVLNVPYGTKSLYQSSSDWDYFNNIVENPHGFVLGTNHLILTSASGSKGSVKIASNDGWTVSSNKSWLTVDPENGVGNNTILLSAEANTTSENRVAIVTVTSAVSEVQPQTIQVTQSGLPKIINISAGRLASALTANELSTILNLKITGIMDARDFKTLRDNMPKLNFLDISEVTIAAYSGPLGPASWITTYAANTIPDYSFNNGASSQNSSLAAVLLPSTLTSIENSAFYSCELLSEIVIPNSVTFIGNSAFGSCNSLANVTLSDHLITIENSAFMGGIFSSIIIPNTVTSIGQYGFAYCKNLEMVVIPNSVTSIGSSAFENCSALSDLTIGNSVTYLGYSAFTGCSSLSSVIIPNSVTTMVGSAFSNCSNLKSVILPNSISTIGSSCFYQCTNLTGVIIPASVTKIENYAFNGCRSLTDISIPSTVTSIANSAFSNCNGLKSITVENEIPIDLSSSNGVFTGIDVTNCILNVPFGAKPAYVTANQWKDFVNIVENVHGFKLSINSVKLSAIEGSKASVAITSNDQWTTVSDQIWLKVSPASGTSNDSIKLIADANISSVPRTALVTVTSGGVSKIITIIQSASPKVINITAGGLATALTVDELNSITNLTLTGTIDARDFKTMRDNMPKLESVDISAVNIIAYIGTDGTSGSYTYTYLVNQIPQNAFYNSSTYTGKITLESIKLASSATSIGDNAFQYCSGLTNISIPGLVNTIGSSAFQKCTGLSSIDIPNSVISIGGNTFQNCTGLTDIDIPNSVKSIGNNAFQYCSGLTNLRISDALTTLNWYNFSDCSRLKNVTLGKSLKTIGYAVFQNCSLLTQVIMNDSLKTIGDNAFGNTGFVDFTIPETVTSIGSSAFSNCKGLTEMVIPDFVTIIGSSAFSNCTGLTKVTLGNTLATIKSGTFYGCTGLTNIVIPESVTSIESSVFSSCSSLTNITIPNSVTSIGSEAFKSCVGLTTFTIPASVTRIDWSAFNSCTNLSSLYAYPLIPVDLSSVGMSSNVFYNVDKTSCTLYVPYQTKALYAAAIQWKDFINIIENQYGLELETNEAKLLYTEGSNVTIKITSNTSWNVVSDQSWLKVTPLVSSGNNSITLTADANPTMYIRTATVTIAATGVPSKTINIKQMASPKVLIINAGGLKSSLSVDELRTISNLQLSGTIDARDFKTMRDGMPALSSLNISNVNIAAYTGADGTMTSGWTYPVNEIPREAFFNSSSYSGKISLKSVILPLSIVSFGDNAFKYCSGLDSITIPNSVKSLTYYLFESCTGLKKVKIGNSVTSIGQYAFRGCKALTDVNIPASVTLLGSYAFEGCSGLTDLTIPTSVTKIDYGAFSGCSGLKAITIPNSVTSIGTTAFEDCSGLKNIILSNSISIIEYGAFRYCTGLTEVIVPSSVTSIGSSAFYGCTSLTNIVIPNSVKTIDYNSFSKCIGLKNIVLPNSVTSIGGHAFGECTGLTNIILSNSLTLIDFEAFYSCTALTAINMPNTVTTIGCNAFQNCVNLRSLTISNSVTSIGSEAFRSCSGLTVVSIPASVTRIDWSAFYSCTGLTSIYAYPTTPVDLSSAGMSPNIFYNVNKTNCMLYVPKGSKNLYQSAIQWKDFLNIIEMTTGLSTEKANSIRIYPNPVSDKFKIIGLNKDAILSIFDLNSKLIFTKQVNGDESISVEELPKGIYIVRINTNEGFIERKLLKK